MLPLCQFCSVLLISLMGILEGGIVAWRKIVCLESF
jgi:hypothetical protein